MESGFYIIRTEDKYFYDGRGRFTPELSLAYRFNTWGNAASGAQPYLCDGVLIIHIRPEYASDKTPTKR